MADATSILITGAGPTGLVLAIWLAKLGVRFRIIEKNSGPGQASRAMAVQARTLEFYRQLGFADQVVASGLKMERLHLLREGREAAVLNLGDFGKGLSPYPFVLSFPQDDHERLLVEQLRTAGVEVEWNTELLRFDDDGSRVRATLRRNGVEETCDVQYLCGCDGARSVVRQGLNIGFPGGTYDHIFYVTDVSADGGVKNRDINIHVQGGGFGLALPIRSTGQLRLIGVVPDQLAGRENIAFEDIREHVEKSFDVRVTNVNWFSTYHVHHRVADHFRAGRAFLSGDAGHLHSPAGGQGMNTGLGDATNLAWKLAHVVQCRAGAAILDTYEVERIAFARSLVATTDKLFQGAVGRGVGSKIARGLIPTLAPLLFRFPAARRTQFRLVSQIRINYRQSALSGGSAGEIHGGDRLPWVDLRNGGNFEPLKSLDWQVHVYGTAQISLREKAASCGFPVHEFPWSDGARQAGLAENAFYVVRPDGYVAIAGQQQEASLTPAFYIGDAARPS